MTKMIPYKCPVCKNSKNFFLKFQKNNSKLYFCESCKNGFTFPVPKNLKKYYSSHYWITKGTVGYLKEIIYTFFQRRRKNWIIESISQGKLLDVGSGKGNFAKSLSAKYNVTNLDPYFSQHVVEKESISFVKKDLLKWQTEHRFDAVVFWESLEHVSDPLSYLKKANKILKDKGKIFIECPNFISLESRIFGKNWVHLDIPRHMVHLTPNGIVNLLEKSNFKGIKINAIIAPEYTIGGFIVSLLSILSIETLDDIKKGNLLVTIAAFPIIPIAIFFEFLFFVIGNTPLMLATAEK